MKYQDLYEKLLADLDAADRHNKYAAELYLNDQENIEEIKKLYDKTYDQYASILDQVDTLLKNFDAGVIRPTDFVV